MKNVCLPKESVVDCLRKRKVEDIVRVELKTPDYLTAFGPIIDSIVVPSDPRKHQWLTSGHTMANNSKLKPQPQMSVGAQYDLLFGTNQIESPCIFGASEERLGIDGSRRDRVLRTLVRNLFDFHQQVINGLHFPPTVLHQIMHQTFRQPLRDTTIPLTYFSHPILKLRICSNIE